VTRIVHLNGKLVPESDARISPFDRGFLLGDGVFETMRAYGGRCFAMDEHLARLAGSCALLRLDVPDGLPSIVDDVLRANDLRDAAVRITITRGPGGRGASPTGAGPATLVVHALPIAERPETWTRGLRLASTRRAHAALPGAKTVDYAANVVARIEAEEAGADEALFVDPAGRVVEATQANVFALFGRELVTPPLESGCLPGVTRAALLRLAPALGLTPVERALRSDQLLLADDAMLSASVLEVAPVVALDGAPIGTGVPSRVARALHTAYRNYASGSGA
jgi:branched-chain amino acid aminotransferase